MADNCAFAPMLSVSIYEFRGAKSKRLSTPNLTRRITPRTTRTTGVRIDRPDTYDVSAGCGMTVDNDETGKIYTFWKSGPGEGFYFVADCTNDLEIKENTVNVYTDGNNNVCCMYLVLSVQEYERSNVKANFLALRARLQRKVDLVVNDLADLTSSDVSQ